MNVAAELLDRARACGASSIAIVGTGKNVGKSVAIGALADELTRTRVPYGLCSIGRDGEAVDVLVDTPKPRFALRAGALVATARALVPRSPAFELVAATGERCALGAIVIARVRAPAIVEIAGPPQASALRRIVADLRTRVPFVLVDGAIDRVAALRDGDDAIVVATGAAVAPTMAAAVDAAAALVARLALPLAGVAPDAIEISGALTAHAAADHARAFGRSRPLVVADPTRVAFGGRTLLDLLPRLDLRVRRTLRPIACTIASIGPQRAFAPRDFMRAVAEATGLPTFDVYAQALA